MRDPSGLVVKDPDMAVQERLGLVFEMFLKFRMIMPLPPLNARDWNFEIEISINSNLPLPPPIGEGRPPT
jgi:hypothetical protein